jgi:hypothetical protein
MGLFNTDENCKKVLVNFEITEGQRRRLIALAAYKKTRGYRRLISIIIKDFLNNYPIGREIEDGD